MPKLALKKAKSTLLAYELEIARVDSILKQKKELMALHLASMDNREYILCKVDLENYQTYKIRLLRIRRTLERRLDQILKNYFGDTGTLLYDYFVNEKSVEQIAQEHNVDEKSVAFEIARKEIELEKLQ